MEDEMGAKRIIGEKNWMGWIGEGMSWGILKESFGVKEELKLD